MPRQSEAPGVAARGEWRTTSVGDAQAHSTTREVAIAIPKRGRTCIIAKLVTAHPLGRLVLAMPYRNRQEVDHVSMPPAVLTYVRTHGATLWIVRLDGKGECYALSLAAVERAGWLQASEGKAEWFVPLDRFERIPWQDWAFLQHTVTIADDPRPGRPPVMQLSLFGDAA